MGDVSEPEGTFKFSAAALEELFGSEDWKERERAHRLEYETAVASGAATPRREEVSPFPNPYWDEVKVIPGEDISLRFDRVWQPSSFGDLLRGNFRDWRDELVRKYSWAITAPESVRFVAEHARGGLVEIGAGNGYWAACLKHLGVVTVPYDKDPPAAGFNWYHSPMIRGGWGRVPQRVATHEWYPVRRGRPWHASRWPHRTLFLCWPPYKTLMAASALRHYRGNRLIYIGEYDGGCNAGSTFFRRLEAEWDEVAHHRPVQWSGLHDWITVYERAAQPRPWRADDEYGYTDEE